MAKYPQETNICIQVRPFQIQTRLGVAEGGRDQPPVGSRTEPPSSAKSKFQAWVGPCSLRRLCRRVPPASASAWGSGCPWAVATSLQDCLPTDSPCVSAAALLSLTRTPVIDLGRPSPRVAALPGPSLNSICTPFFQGRVLVDVCVGGHGSAWRCRARCCLAGVTGQGGRADACPTQNTFPSVGVQGRLPPQEGRVRPASPTPTPRASEGQVFFRGEQTTVVSLNKS